MCVLFCMEQQVARAAHSKIYDGISACTAAVNLALSVIAVYGAVRFVVWTWAP